MFTLLLSPIYAQVLLVDKDAQKKEKEEDEKKKEEKKDVRGGLTPEQIAQIDEISYTAKSAPDMIAGQFMYKTHFIPLLNAPLREVTVQYIAPNPTLAHNFNYFDLFNPDTLRKIRIDAPVTVDAGTFIKTLQRFTKLEELHIAQVTLSNLTGTHKAFFADLWDRKILKNYDNRFLAMVGIEIKELKVSMYMGRK